MNTKPQSPFAERIQHVPQSFIREILKVTADPAVVSFAGGLPNPSFFPVAELKDCASSVLEAYGSQILQYATTEGYYPLREFLAMRYKRRYQLDIRPEQILITNGSQQSLDLVGKLFINPGDKVLLERPTYLGALQCFSMYQPDFLDAEVHEDGVDIQQLQHQLLNHPIKLFYSIPNFQNPTGIQYSMYNRQQATALLSQHPVVLIEDDPYGDICFTDETPPPMYAFMPEKTVLLGSFSKTVSPGLRLGWMVADEGIIQKATILKQATDLHTANLAQYILYQFVTKYDLETHINTIRGAYKKQRDVMFRCLGEYFPASVRYTKAKGGMFTWLTLPEGVSARALLQKAIQQNIVFVPGDTFYASASNERTLRLNYSNVEEARMCDAMYKLAAMIQ